MFCAVLGHHAEEHKQRKQKRRTLSAFGDVYMSIVWTVRLLWFVAHVARRFTARARDHYLGLLVDTQSTCAFEIRTQRRAEHCRLQFFNIMSSRAPGHSTISMNSLSTLETHRRGLSFDISFEFLHLGLQRHH